MVARAIRKIRMVSIVIVTAFFPSRADDLRGFGVLFPRSSGIRALGALFNAEIFEGRSRLRSETWIYGDLDPSALPAENEASACVVQDRHRLTGRDDAPIAVYTKVHRNALPVYDRAVLDAHAALSSLPPRLAVAGNYLGQLGVSALVDSAAATALHLHRYGSSTDADRGAPAA
jgi:protoporphyrinogen oxidase